MDALLVVAVEEVGLEGREGCTVETLWSLLASRLPVGTITSLPPQLKNIVWNLLVHRTEDLQLCLPQPPNQPDDGRAAEETGKKPRGSRSKNAVDSSPLAKATRLSADDPRVRHHDTAAANGVRLVASESVRMSVLGVYEIQDSRFPLSDVQLAALEAVGRTRWRGTINADLANRLGIAYRNFHYIVKNLEARTLVVKNPVVFAPPGASVTVSSVLHLPRFQPAVKLGPGQMFKTVDAVRGMEVATYVLQDDNLYMRLVCSTIAETAERLVVESDLKIVCGFRGTRGHRMWRRLRRKLEEQGYLSFESCRVRDRLVPCVRLLKDWKPPAAGEGEEAEEGEEGDGEEGGGCGGVVLGVGAAGGGFAPCGGLHVAELSLERQLLEGILSAGADGVLNVELFAKLGVSSKVYGSKLVETIRRYNIQVTVVNRGRVVLNRLVAPPELLAAAEHLGPTLAPAPGRGGHNTAQQPAAGAGAGAQGGGVTAAAAETAGGGRGGETVEVPVTQTGQVAADGEASGAAGSASQQQQEQQHQVAPVVSEGVLKGLQAEAKAEEQQQKQRQGARRQRKKKEEPGEARVGPEDAGAAAAGGSTLADTPADASPGVTPRPRGAGGKGGRGTSTSTAGKKGTGADKAEADVAAAAVAVAVPAAGAEGAAKPPAARPRRSAAARASEGAAAALKALREGVSGGRRGGGGVSDSGHETGGDDDDGDEEYDVEAEAAAGRGGEGGSDSDSSSVGEQLEEEQEGVGDGKEPDRSRRQKAAAGAGEGKGRAAGGAPPAKRPRLSEGTVAAAAAEGPGPAATAPTGDAAPLRLTLPVTGDPAVGGVSALKERKPHWTKVITLKTEDRLRLLVEHLETHRFISRVQVRRLVMEWESAASGKPVPSSGAGPDIKTIRRLMDRLAHAGKARLIRVETAGFLGDNRPIDTLLRPDIPETPELHEEIRKHMAEFERKLRSDCCRKALAMRKQALAAEMRVGNVLPEMGGGTSGAGAGGPGGLGGGGSGMGEGVGVEGGGGGVGAMQSDDTAEGGLSTRSAALPGPGATITYPAGADTAPPADGSATTATGYPPPCPTPIATTATTATAAAGLPTRTPAALLPGGPGVRPHPSRIGPSTGPAPPTTANLIMGRGVSLFRAVHNEATARSVENGLIPAKMVRVRLLHFLIAKLVGLGGFEADPLAGVDPDPGSMPHMPLTLGDELLALASASERSRLAFAFGAMKRATGSEGGKGGGQQGQGAGVLGAGAGEGEEGVGGDGVVRYLSVRRLWSIMPLSVALQVLGSTSRRPPEELARLCESGATLGSLLPDQARDIMDGTSVHRLEYLISILRRLRLLEWAVVDRERPTAVRRPGPGAGVRAREGQGVMLLVHAKGVLEVPPTTELSATTATATTTATPTAPSVGQLGPNGLRLLEVELVSSAGLDEYWRRFEELFRLEGGSSAEVARLKKCFPATTVPELLSRNSWQGQRLMAAVQWLRLQAGLDACDLSDTAQISAIAAQLSVAQDVMSRIVADRRRRLNRLGGLEAGEAGGAAAAEGEEGAGGGAGGGPTGGSPLRLARLYLGVRGTRLQGVRQGGLGAGGAGGAQGAEQAGEAQQQTRRPRSRRVSLRHASPTTRDRLLAERAAEREAAAARKAARAARRQAKDEAKAARRAARASGAALVRRRRRRPAPRTDAEESEGISEGEGVERGRKRQRQELPRPSVDAAQLLGEDSALADVGPARRQHHRQHHRAQPTQGPNQPQDQDQDQEHEAHGTHAATGHDDGGSDEGRSGSDAAADSDGGTAGGRGGGGGSGPRVRSMPTSAAPTRMRRVLWTASEDRVLLVQYIRLAADTGPHVRLAWRTCAAALPYSINVCTRHIRYLKRHYPSYTGRLDELLQRAYDKKREADALREAAEARVRGYKERLRRRAAGEAVPPLLEELAVPRKPLDPLDITRSIVANGTESGSVAATAGAAAGAAEAATPAVEGPGEGAAAGEADLPGQTAVNAVSALAATLKGSLAPVPAAAADASTPTATATASGSAQNPCVVAEAAVGMGLLQQPGVESDAGVAGSCPPESPEDPEEAAQMLQLAEKDEQVLAQLAAEREVALVEAQSLAEDFVLVVPRRASQRHRDRLQQQGGLQLGAMLPLPTTPSEAAARRRAAAARRSVLQLQPEDGGVNVAGPAAAAAGAGGGGGNTASAGIGKPSAAAATRTGRRSGAGYTSGLSAPSPSPLLQFLPRPSVSITAAMSCLMSLLYLVRAAGGVSGVSTSQRVVDALADFGRRFPPEVKSSALRHLQLRGWLAPSGPKRQLDLTPSYLARLYGTDLPPNLLLRCTGAAGRLDQLLARSAAAARRRTRRQQSADRFGGLNNDSDDYEEDDHVEQDMEVNGGEASQGQQHVAEGAAAVARSLSLDASGRGVLVLDAHGHEQVPSELVAVLLTRQAVGQLEVLPGAVEAQQEWAGPAPTAGLQSVMVQLMVGPLGVAAAAAGMPHAATGSGAAPAMCSRGPPPAAAGTPVAVRSTVVALEDEDEDYEQDEDEGVMFPQGRGAIASRRRSAGRSAGAAAAGLASPDFRTNSIEDDGDMDTRLDGGSPCWPWSEDPPELPRGAAPLFAPSAVADSAEVRAKATAACKVALAEELPYASEAYALVDAALMMLGGAGPDGLTALQLVAKLHQALAVSAATSEKCGTASPSVGPPAGSQADASAFGSDGGASAAASPTTAAAVGSTAIALAEPPPPHHVALALRALQGHGLVRRLPGWDAEHYVAVQYGADSVVTVPLEGADAGAADVDVAPMDSGAGAATADADAAGSDRVREVPLRPWLDHRGQLNGPLWEALVVRLLGLVVRHPGIREDTVLAALDVVPPEAGRQVLHHLVATGRLAVRTTTSIVGTGTTGSTSAGVLSFGRPGGVAGEGQGSVQPRGRRPMLLGGGAGGGTRGTGTRVVPVVHYFPVLEYCCGSEMLAVLPL